MDDGEKSFQAAAPPRPASLTMNEPICRPCPELPWSGEHQASATGSHRESREATVAAGEGLGGPVA